MGIRLRYKDGRKGALAGGHNGLFVPAGVTAANVDVISEGLTDAAAALTLGFSAVGRPSALEGVDLAVSFVRGGLTTCPCIVADNDASGRAGAEDLAEALHEAGIPCRILHPPEEFEDLRDWLTRGGLTRAMLENAIRAAPIRWPHAQAWPPGFVPTPNALLRRGMVARVGRNASAVLMVIASFRGGDGVCRVGRETIAELTGMSVSAVAKCLPVLREAGLLSWRRGHTNRVNEYSVNLGPERWKHRARKPEHDER